jgi:heme/copper-type cytochrome/quinol oxidase subunit 3
MVSPELHVIRSLPRRGLADHALFGMAVFVFTEVMLFAGFLSAYLIVRNSVPPGMWPPADQPRLPFERTALNTAALLASGVLVWVAHRAASRGTHAQRGSGPAAARWPLSLALALGALFVVLQGAEWASLLRQGLTLESSQVGAFFYLIIGAHALHAVCALGVLAWCWAGLVAGSFRPARFGAAQLLWYFVVLVWPVLWLVVYR